MYRFIHHDL
uniref:A4 n=1 Tax=Arundo donax TaxID=35708 RepID=A0A0A9LJS4_ARUDO